MGAIDLYTFIEHGRCRLSTCPSEVKGEHLQKYLEFVAPFYRVLLVFMGRHPKNVLE